MRIIAIDPGFERLGIAVLEKLSGKDTLLYSSCFKTSPRDSFPERLHALTVEVETVITLHKPNALAIETLFFNTNQKTAMRVAETRGALISLAISRGLSVHEYTPLQVKIAVTGYGRASKSQVNAMVRRLIAITDNDKKIDDEIDAIAVGLTHCNTRSIPLDRARKSSLI